MPGAGGSASLLINAAQSHGSPPNKGRHGCGLPFFLHRLRLRLDSGRALRKNSQTSLSHNRTSSLRPAMRAFKSRAKHPKTRDTSTRNSSGDDVDAAPAPQASSQSPQTSLFARILRRAQSKPSLKRSSSRTTPPAAYPVIPENDEAASSELAQEQLASNGPDKAFRPSRFASASPKPAVENKSTADAYVSKPAASDFSQLPRNIIARNRSPDQDQRQLSSPQATPLLHPGTSRGGRHVQASEGHGDERPTTAATVDTLDEPNEVGARQSNSESREKTYLQAPPSQRQHSMNSYRSATELGTAPEGSSSDYQSFVQQAKHVEQREQEELWKTISSRSKQKSFVPNHPDLNMNLSSLERSGTFGGAKKSPPKPKKSGSMWKRTSLAGQRQTPDDKRRSYTVGGDTLSTDPGSRSGDAARKASATTKAS
jgi:hypothetical protein